MSELQGREDSHGGDMEKVGPKKVGKDKPRCPFRWRVITPSNGELRQRVCLWGNVYQADDRNCLELKGMI